MLTDTVDLLAERIDIAIGWARCLTQHGRATDADALPRGSGQPITHTRYRKPDSVSHHNCLLFPIAGYRSLWIFRDRIGLNEVPIHGKLLVSNASGAVRPRRDGLDAVAGLAGGRGYLAGKLVDVFPQWEVTATDFNTAAWLVYPTRFTYRSRYACLWIFKSRLNG